MEKWQCPDCGYKSPTEMGRCISCGYECTKYDMAAAAEDTGQYLIEEISLSVDKLSINSPSWLKISISLGIGVGIGVAVIALIKLLF